MNLTTKQKAFLKGIGQTTKPLFQIGKDGLSDAFIEMIENAFRTHEIIKISILKTVEDDRKTLAFDLARLTNSELIQIIGRQIILYKPAKQPKILLP